MHKPLLSFTVLLLSGTIAVAQQMPAPANAPAPSATVKLNMPALTTYSEVLSRPLFSPNRRPSEEAPVATVSTSYGTVIPGFGARVCPAHSGTGA